MKTIFSMATKQNVAAHSKQQQEH